LLGIREVHKSPWDRWSFYLTPLQLLASVAGSGPVSSASAAKRQTHIDGTLMLLRLRGEDQFSRPQGRLLYSMILSAMVSLPEEVMKRF